MKRLFSPRARSQVARVLGLTGEALQDWAQSLPFRSRLRAALDNCGYRLELFADRLAGCCWEDAVRSPKDAPRSGDRGAAA
jgi:hypothetical protein